MNLDYQPSVHVKTIKETENDKTKAVAEVAKYPTKISGFTENRR